MAIATKGKPVIAAFDVVAPAVTTVATLYGRSTSPSPSATPPAKVVGLLASCDLLLAQLPSKQVAAFCVQLARIGAAGESVVPERSIIW